MNFVKSAVRIFSKLQNNCYNTTRSNSFTSAISLKCLYPHSNLRLTNISKPPANENQFNGYIPLDQLEISYSRSSGPGGQNVNKVNTKVDVRFHLQSASWLSEEIKKKLLEKCQNSLTKDGCLIFRSDLTRHQQLNLADCLEKIRTLIRNSIKVEAAPTEETIDRIRRRHEKAARERLAVKRVRSQVKSDRIGNISFDQ